MILKEIIDSLLRSHDFGDPWRLSEKNAGLVVPILQKEPIKKPRVYLMLEEVKDQIIIQDSGSINQAKVRNNTDKTVFIRGGGVLEGKGTQSRAVQFGTVVLPQKEQLVPILCVHASHGIRSGAFFAHSGYAPRMVAQRLAAHDQGATWSAVQNYSRASRRNLALMGVSQHFAEDDLVRASQTIERFKTDVEEALKKIPGDLANQVGAVILDLNGVIGVEVFDHPESWHALSNSVMKQYKDVIAEEKVPDYLSINMDRVTDNIKNFLDKAEKTQEAEVHKLEGAATVLLKGEIVGEYTLIGDKPIHLLLTRTEKELTPERLPPLGSSGFARTMEEVFQSPQSARSEAQPEAVFYTTSLGPTKPKPFFRRKDSFKFLANLEQGPKTWSNIASDFKSTATLSKRAKEATSLGLVEKTLRLENGRETYKLTPTGQASLKKAKETYAQ